MYFFNVLYSHNIFLIFPYTHLISQPKIEVDIPPRLAYYSLPQSALKSNMLSCSYMCDILIMLTSFRFWSYLLWIMLSIIYCGVCCFWYVVLLKLSLCHQMLLVRQQMVMYFSTVRRSCLSFSYCFRHLCIIVQNGADIVDFKHLIMQCSQYLTHLASVSCKS